MKPEVISELVVNVEPQEMSIAVLEDKNLVELQKEARNLQFAVGDIYLGKVKKLMPGLNAAFIDVGYKKDAFLHYQDLGSNFNMQQKYLKQVLSDPKKAVSISKLQNEPEIEKDGSIGDILKIGQEVLVQIAKEPISTKGPRLASELSFAGRYIVLIPFGDKVSVSSKIKTSEERARLRQLIQSIKPKNFTVIVRTSAEGRRVAELDHELRTLVARWEESIAKLSKDKIPSLIYEETGRAVALLRDIYKDFKIIMSERAVAINLVLPLGDEESHITSDRERISKIVYHLLDNSLKYTAQGKITFGYRLADDRSHMLISVNDTGIGIPQRRQMLLTQIFEDRQADIMNLHEKMGLGLTIAQRNARLLQGTLTFKSTQGVGSTFTLRLPTHIDDVAVPSGAVIADPNYPTVLIVEAESTSFLYLKVLMERLGANLWLVQHARTPEEAVAACRNKEISMVLAGVNLSSEAGLKAIEEIHAISATLPIVAVLPSGSKSQVDDAMASGASDYLVKPVNRNDLMRLCRKYLGRYFPPHKG